MPITGQRGSRIIDRCGLSSDWRRLPRLSSTTEGATLIAFTRK